MTSLYRQILKKAWLITKKFFYLWPLGLFTAFLGNGGEYQVLLNQSSLVANQPAMVSFWKTRLNALMPNLGVESGEVLSLFFLGVITLIFLIFFLWLVISSFGGLIKGAALANRDEKSTFKQLLTAGSKKFWPILGLLIIAKIIVYGFLILIIGPLIIVTFSKNASVNLLVVALAFIVFIPLTIIVSLVTRYAASYLMLTNQTFRESFKNAWLLFRANWLISLEMAFILFVINIIVGLVYLAVSLLVFSPFFVFTLGAPQLFDILIYFSITLLIIISAFVGSWLATFQTSSWILLFIRLTEGGRAYSKIVRWAAEIPQVFKRKNV